MTILVEKSLMEVPKPITNSQKEIIIFSAIVDNQILNFTIFAKRISYLEANDLIMIYHDGSKFIAKLENVDKKAIANATIQFTINNKTYDNITDANGFVYLTINLDSGYYPIYAEFKGNATYNASSANKTMLTQLSSNHLVKTYDDEVKFVANFTDSNKTALANTKIKFNIMEYCILKPDKQVAEN